MVAGAAVGKGQVLVRVPRTLMMTAESAAADPEYGELAGGSGLTEWQVGEGWGSTRRLSGRKAWVLPLWRLSPSVRVACAERIRGALPVQHSASCQNGSVWLHTTAPTTPLHRLCCCTCCARGPRGQPASGHPTSPCCLIRWDLIMWGQGPHAWLHVSERLFIC